MQLRQSFHPGVGFSDSSAPLYLSWQNQSTDQLKAQFNEWLSRLKHLWRAVDLILMMARNSQEFNPVRCESGFYRDSMIGKSINQIQLIRVVCHTPGVYPEVNPRVYPGVDPRVHPGTYPEAYLGINPGLNPCIHECFQECIQGWIQGCFQGCIKDGSRGRSRMRKCACGVLGATTHQQHQQ